MTLTVEIWTAKRGWRGYGGDPSYVLRKFGWVTPEQQESALLKILQDQPLLLIPGLVLRYTLTEAR